MKKSASARRASLSRWQLHLEDFGLLRLAPQTFSSDDPPRYEEEYDQNYVQALRQRERWLSR